MASLTLENSPSTCSRWNNGAFPQKSNHHEVRYHTRCKSEQAGRPACLPTIRLLQLRNARSIQYEGFNGPERPASYLSEGSKQETMAMTIITGRRGALKTFALTMATSAIGLAWGDRPAAAAVEPAWMPPGATHLEA